MSKIEDEMNERAELRNISDARDVRIFPDAITAAKRLLLMPHEHQIKFQVWSISDGIELHLFDGGSQELIDFVEIISKIDRYLDWDEPSDSVWD